MGGPSWIDVLEASYDVDCSEDDWLDGIARASTPMLDEGFGVFAFAYDASVPERIRIGRFARTRDTTFDAQAALAGIQAAGGGQYVRDTFRCLQTAAVRSTPGFAGSEAERAFEATGVGDVVAINGVDPSGIGVCVGAVTAKRTKLSRAQRLRYSRIATHLANGYRLRRRLAAPPEPCRAREQLRAAAVAIDRARARSRRVEPDSALAGWLGLVDGRWSLVDKFDSGGNRYVLARRNDPHVRGLDLLTDRERAIAGYAVLGHDNKLIAYELGIADSTVRVLLARAAQKLGVRSRDELTAAVRAAAAAGDLRR